jgi:hypothetical protein
MPRDAPEGKTPWRIDGPGFRGAAVPVRIHKGDDGLLQECVHVPNGMGLLPDGRLTVSDNQGIRVKVRAMGGSSFSELAYLTINAIPE